MKKLIFLVLMLFLASTFVFAQGEGTQTQTGVDSNETDDSEDTDEEETEDENEEEIEIEVEEETNGKERVRKKVRVKLRAENVEELKEIVRLRAEELNLSIGQVKKQFSELHRNQNRVRLAVHALLAMENLTGGIGKEISAIARDFDNSVDKTTDAEEKIAKRGRLRRLFAGGDHEAAEEIRAELEATEEKVEKLKQLRESCEEECSEEVHALMKEQADALREERARLKDLAKEELGSKGIFGWIWK
ncbi:hypothetical protein ACFLZZ_03490 [Nanoarchaeota archaeon]